MSAGGHGGERTRLFAYGTLMVPEVFRAVCGASRSAGPAVLAGYARFLVRGEVFPAIVPKAGANTPGVVYERVTRAMWIRLDAFETDFYRRVTVTVTTAAGEIDADTYVAGPAGRRLLTTQAFDPEHFAAEQARAYLTRYG